MWCPSCYFPHPSDKFHVNKPQDSSGFERVLPKDENRFRYARTGDHIMTPFQCDKCLFYMLKQRRPMEEVRKDQMLLCCIRRANLDAFWAREPSTVQRNASQFRKMVSLLDTVGLEPQVEPLGPFPNRDVLGVSVAVSVLLKSLEPGKYANYSQFETIRKLRSAFSNQYLASVTGCMAAVSIGKTSSKMVLAQCPTQSLWYEKFSYGCLKRMGQVIKQDLAISIDVMLELINQFKQDIPTLQGAAKFYMIQAAAFSVIAFCGSFRGNEVFLVDLGGLNDYYEKTEEEKKHVIVPLLGRFKGETGERYHLTPLAAVTNSGIQVRSWIGLLLASHKQIGRITGPAFTDVNGNLLPSHKIQFLILRALTRVQLRCPNVIPANVEVHEEYGISRSFRRGATTHARNQGVKVSDIEAANRWRNVENSQGRKINQPMRDHYMEVKQMLPTLLRFSQAL